jgi:hypothetical protein
LVHVTVLPAATTNGFVPKAVVVRLLAPLGIDTVSDVPVDVVLGDVVVDDELGVEELLHAEPAAARTATIRILRNAIRLLYGSISAARTSRKLTADRFV